jgi:hypothetical protein
MDGTFGIGTHSAVCCEQPSELNYIDSFSQFSESSYTRISFGNQLLMANTLSVVGEKLRCLVEDLQVA